MDLSLLQMVYTRISHDLSSSSGAIYNGTELLAEDVSMLTETTLLIQNSAKTLLTRLKFFRQTFGVSVFSTDDMTAEYLKTLTALITMNGCCVTALQRVICMVLGDVLMRGGHITVEDSKITATASVLRNVDVFLPMLTQGVKSEKPDESPARYAYFLAKEQNISLRVDLDGQTLTVYLDKAE